MMNTAITIGNATPESFGAWLGDTDLSLTIVPTCGYWHGKPEQSIVVVLWGADGQDAQTVLDRYGKDHPEEEAFGLMAWPDSALVTNVHHYVK